MRVAIVAMGRTLDQYIDATKMAGGRSALYDQVWAVNDLAGVIDCDAVFHMDDFRVQQERADRGNKRIEGLLNTLKKCSKPIFTSVPQSEYPTSVEYPLEFVINETGVRDWPYFNHTVPYAVAYAVAHKYQEIHLFGMDYDYAGGKRSEKGRACTEWWCGFAEGRGQKVRVAKGSTLKDTNMPTALRLYGHDGVKVTMDKDGHIKREPIPLPTAEEIEARYLDDHRGYQ